MYSFITSNYALEKRMKRILVLFGFFISTAMAGVFTPTEIDTLKDNFIANITTDGAVMASPSKFHPNYYFDWVRDSAIAMDLVETWYEQDKSPADKERLLNYVNRVIKIQHQTDSIPGQDILGEPKFYLDGRPFDGAWGRPQNDGPALRALTLIRFAHQLIKDNEIVFVQTYLYGGGLNPMTMGAIKMDLEYTAHHWQEENFDLWEEVYGHHFFTRMAQRKALLEGANLARLLNEPSSAIFYESQASLIEDQLKKHIDNNLIQATLPPHPGPQKTNELDSAVILGVLIANTEDGVFAPDDLYVKNTVMALTKQFKSLYPVNSHHQEAILFGRYPGDTYDGYESNSVGNPWFILTATMAEYYYTLAYTLPVTNENLPMIIRYIKQGDAFLTLIKTYAPSLNLSEQINLNNGSPQGAYSLSWSYVAVLRAINAREILFGVQDVVHKEVADGLKLLQKLH
jgi:glucoamylase